MIRFLSKARKGNLRGTAILRLDFNTEDDWRMKITLPTVKFLLKAGSRIIVVSHKGRPKGVDKKLSLRKDSQKLARLLGRKVRFIAHFRFLEIKRKLEGAKPGSIFVLENIRFLSGEGKNSRSLARNLASLGDFYVNEAFADSHRRSASIVGITKFLPSLAGFQFEEEVKSLAYVIRNAKRPLVVVAAGGKVEEKLGLLNCFKNRADYFLIGGAAANTLLWLKGTDIGDSAASRIRRREYIELLKYRNIVLPSDFRLVGRKILDIGPRTIREFSRVIATARTVILSGPLGLIEKKSYDRGTLAVARAIARNRRAFSLAGGGETVMFLKRYGLDKKFSFISTGGGAMLDFLAGKKMPGIKALEENTRHQITITK